MGTRERIPGIELVDPSGRGEGFGSSVAATRDLIAVGSGGHTGSIAVFERDVSGGWSGTNLAFPRQGSSPQFGISVTAKQQTIVAGAPGDTTRAGFWEDGSVTVFEPDGSGGWSATKLNDPDGDDFVQFGASVAVTDNSIVVGSPGDLGGDGEKPKAGSVVIFERDGQGGWVVTGRLSDPQAGRRGQFGTSVAASDRRIVIGAPLDRSRPRRGTGSVTVFEPDGSGDWSATKLTGSDTDIEAFGESVALGGGRIVVGAPYSFDEAGSVTVFEPDGWGGWSPTRLTEPRPRPRSLFGSCVAAGRHTILVGAPGAFRKIGSATLFRLDGEGNWSATKIRDPVVGATVNFGSSVALFAGHMVIGNPTGNTISVLPVPR
jgi:hypothetical protein